MSVKENPGTSRHRAGSKISETMTPILANPPGSGVVSDHGFYEVRLAREEKLPTGFGSGDRGRGHELGDLADRAARISSWPRVPLMPEQAPGAGTRRRGRRRRRCLVRAGGSRRFRRPVRPRRWPAARARPGRRPGGSPRSTGSDHDTLAITDKLFDGLYEHTRRQLMTGRPPA